MFARCCKQEMAMNTLWQDLRYAIRALGKNKGFAAIAILTIALGIGANTAIFSVTYGVMLRPLPLPEPERIYQLELEYRGQFNQTNFAYHHFEFVRENNHWSSAIAALTHVGFNLSTGRDAKRVSALHVSSDYFQVMGVRPSLGRDFLAEEDRGGGSLVVILSHALWRQHFGGDPTVIGRSVQLDGKPYTVVGVMPSGFDDTQHVDLWTTLAPVAHTIGSGMNLDIIARLKPGLTPQQAGAQVDALNPAFQNAQSDDVGKENRLAIYPMRKTIGAEVGSNLWILLGAVSFVLLIACANVANLLLARGAGRAKEVAVRTALGASRGRLVRQFLTESILLALLGGAFGLLLARLSLSWLLHLAPVGLPRINEIRIDDLTFLFVLGITLLTGIFFGLAPAFHSAKAGINSMLKEGAGRATGGPRGGRLRGALVVSEVALSLILLVGAALLSETFLNLQRVNPGFDPGHVLSAEIWITGSRYHSSAQLSAFFEDLANQLKRIHGVEEAAVVSAGQPLERGGNVPVTVSGEADSDSVDYRVITPNYFTTIGTPVLDGRSFSAADAGSSEPVVVVVNQAFVRRYFASRNPLGASVRVADEANMRAVVGITGDVKSYLGDPAAPTVFVPQAQASLETTLLFDGWFPTHIFVRTSGDPARLTRAVEQTILAADSSLPIGKVLSMEQILAHSLALQRFMMVLLALFASLALLLAAVGIYGVMSYTVSQRMQEMGIRIALGAQPGKLLQLILGEGLRLVLLGTAIGIAGALALYRLLTGMLFGVRPTDPLTIAATAFFLFAVTLLACYLPARRATRVDPLIALRYE
jgi:putative ABC transport system permease protein